MFTKSPTGLIVIRLFSTAKDKYHLMSADVLFLCMAVCNFAEHIWKYFFGICRIRKFPYLVARVMADFRTTPLIMWPAKAENSYFFRMKMIDIA